MAVNENFDNDLGNYYVLGGGAWTGATGFPAAGCAAFDLSSLSNGLGNNTDTQVVAAGDSFYFYWRVINGETFPDGTDVIGMSLLFDDGGGGSPFTSLEITGAEINTSDTGWQLATVVIPPSFEGYTLVDVFCDFATLFDVGAMAYIDTILMDADPPTTGLTFELTHSAGGIPGAVLI